MRPYFESGAQRIFQGDCREVLPRLELASYDLVLADPPYGDTSLDWDVRDLRWLELAGPLVKPTGSIWCWGSLEMFMEQAAGIAALGWKRVQEVQLNFHADKHAADSAAIASRLTLWGDREYIFQFDDINDALMGAVRERGVRAVPLFDTSGGAGIEPGSWPAPIGDYCGYAGGLHPNKIDEQLARIKAAAGDARIWIDIETHVRSADDRVFDLAKVETFLAACAPHVEAAAGR